MKRVTRRKLSILLVVTMLLGLYAPYLATQKAVAEENSASEALAPSNDIPENHIRIHYQRKDGNYTNLGLWTWNDVVSPSEGWPFGATLFNGKDDYGVYLDIELKEGAKNIGFLVVNVVDGVKDGGDKGYAITNPEIKELWIKEGSDEVFIFEPVELPENTVRIHYVRTNGDYENYGAWIWGDVKVASGEMGKWPDAALDLMGKDKYGAYVDIELKENAKQIGFVMLDKTKGDGGKDGGDKIFNLLDRYHHLWVRQGDDNVYVTPYWDMATGITSAEVISKDTILVYFTLTAGLTEEQLKSGLVIVDKEGNPKIVKRCTYPITALKCVNRIYTDCAVIEVTEDGLLLTELAPGFTVDDIQAMTEPALRVSDRLKQMI